ncbi:SDR family oxidoreductase [Bacillus sp. AFS031507]|uniref:SDR family oxidoreductase n=1 Tax=Bacillus sp. AFS031507 TaxID=2033496 RepID=UPI00211E4981|nr:SDR family oxidoreductase [Bacillus sp. AFS031507]
MLRQTPSADSVQTLVDYAVQRNENLDIMFNNAGIACSSICNVLDMPHEEYLWTFNINQHGVFYGIQAAGNVMEGGDYHDQGFPELNNFVNGLIQHGTNVAYKRI